MSEKLLWEYEDDYLRRFNKAIKTAHSNECKTLKDYMDLGFNSIHYNGKVYYKSRNGLNGNYRYESEEEFVVPEEILNKKVELENDEEDADGYWSLYLKDSEGVK